MKLRASVMLLVAAAGIPALFVNCGGGGSGGGKRGLSNVDGGDSGAEPPRTDGGYPPVEPTDPCSTAGYYFDGKSDCDEVRCPELTCDCPSSIEVPDGAPPPPPDKYTMHACVPGKGCLDLADCTRVCDPAARLTRNACEERIANAGAQSCKTDEDCGTGHCRQESVGKICVDALHCAEDGHCGDGFLCRFDPGSLDSTTSLPTSLGTCANGELDSVCYENDDCKYGTCSGNRCAGGRENDSCKFNSNCASGFCRISSTTGDTGYCVTGKQGGSCADDGDCASGLHCTSGTCFTSATGQQCEEDADCASEICVQSLCRGGEPGSTCEEDADCKEGVCAGYQCASGGLLSPCYDAADCKTGLRCAHQVCTDGSVGSPCYTDTDCTVLACVRGACSAGENGDVCDAPGHCKSNRCADPAGVEPGQCTSGAKGSHCLYNADCVSGSCSLKGACN